jgi:hypothetical protein
VAALVPPGVLTKTSTVPVPAGEVAVQELAVQLVTVAAAVPNPAVPPDKLEPVIVTTVPPEVGPLVGLILVTFGAGGTS